MKKILPGLLISVPFMVISGFLIAMQEWKGLIAFWVIIGSFLCLAIGIEMAQK